MSKKTKKLKKIELIDKAIKLGLVEKQKHPSTGFDVLIQADRDCVEVSDEWENLEDWVNKQRHIHIKLDIGKELK